MFLSRLKSYIKLSEFFRQIKIPSPKISTCREQPNLACNVSRCLSDCYILSLCENQQRVFAYSTNYQNITLHGPSWQFGDMTRWRGRERDRGKRKWREEDVEGRECGGKRMLREEDVEGRGCGGKRKEDVEGRECGGKRMWREEDVEGRGCGGKRMWREEDVEGRGCGGKRMWREENVEGRGCGGKREERADSGLSESEFDSGDEPEARLRDGAVVIVGYTGEVVTLCIEGEVFPEVAQTGIQYAVRFVRFHFS